LPQFILEIHDAHRAVGASEIIYGEFSTALAKADVLMRATGAKK